jgi:predicted dehydrogenase
VRRWWVGNLVIRVGIIGFHEGNGHPFSFSAILNGYDPAKFAACGWPTIHDYLSRRDPADFGVLGLRVTHAWMPSFDMTRLLCDACDIAVAARNLDEMLGSVDAVVIARDDPESHWDLAAPFLQRGVPVFVDKPLANTPEVLSRFSPYLESGKLMSCSGMRYATELDEPRSALASYGKLKLVRAALVLDWTHYGIHAIDAILGAVPLNAVAVVPHAGDHESFAIETREGTLIQIDSLGAVPKLFRFDFIGTQRVTSHDVNDNFSMFRRTLWHFAEMIRTGVPPIALEQALQPLKILMAGEVALQRRSRVEIGEVGLQ